MASALLIACVASLTPSGIAAAQPRETWKGQPGSVRGLAVSPDGKILASCTNEGTLTLWDLATKKKVGTILTKQGSLNGSFTPDGKSLATIGSRPPKEGENPLKGGLCSAKVWDVATRKERLTFDIPQGGAAGGVITPDGKSLIVGGLKTGVVLYDLATGKPSEPLDLDKAYWDVMALALSPDGKTLAVGTRSSSIVLWDLEKKAARATIPPDEKHGATVLAFSPDGKTVAAGGFGNGGVALWDAGNGKSLGALDFDPRVLDTQAIAFSPDGKTLAVGGTRWGVSLADVAAGGERDDFEGDIHTFLVFCVVFTPDGKTLISGGGDMDQAIWFWDVPQGKCKGVKPAGQLTPQDSADLKKAFGH